MSTKMSLLAAVGLFVLVMYVEFHDSRRILELCNEMPEGFIYARG